MAKDALGQCTHYYDKLGVAVVQLAKGVTLKKGDKIKFKGSSTDFTQVVDSIQVDHKDVDQVKAGDSFGLKVDKKVHESDKVYAA